MLFQKLELSQNFTNFKNLRCSKNFAVFTKNSAGSQKLALSKNYICIIILSKFTLYVCIPALVPVVLNHLSTAGTISRFKSFSAILCFLALLCCTICNPTGSFALMLRVCMANIFNVPNHGILYSLYTVFSCRHKLILCSCWQAHCWLRSVDYKSLGQGFHKYTNCRGKSSVHRALSIYMTPNRFLD